MNGTYYRTKMQAMVKNFDNILINAFCNGYRDEILDEDLELCQELTNRIVDSIVRDSVYDKIVSILQNGVSSYGCFDVSFSLLDATIIAKQLWQYRDDIKGYATLAKQEAIIYPLQEVKRLNKINIELELDLKYADKK